MLKVLILPIFKILYNKVYLSRVLYHRELALRGLRDTYEKAIKEAESAPYPMLYESEEDRVLKDTIDNAFINWSVEEAIKRRLGGFQNSSEDRAKLRILEQYVSSGSNKNKKVS